MTRTPRQRARGYYNLSERWRRAHGGRYNGKPKDVYPTREAAERMIAVDIGRWPDGEVPHAYECHWGDSPYASAPKHWHIGRPSKMKGPL